MLGKNYLIHESLVQLQPAGLFAKSYTLILRGPCQIGLSPYRDGGLDFRRWYEILGHHMGLHILQCTLEPATLKGDG